MPSEATLGKGGGDSWVRGVRCRAHFWVRQRGKHYRTLTRRDCPAVLLLIGLVLWYIINTLTSKI